jgi:GT2 family glycosyltransferase
MPGDSSRAGNRAAAGSAAVSVVMVAYGRGWEWVPKALDALHRNTAEPFEVILVDNGGSDGGEHDIPSGSCTLVHNDENVGFGPASNQGGDLARSGILCFLNPDVLVEPGWLSPLIEALRDQAVGAAFPAKLNLDGTMQEAGAFVTAEGLSYVFGDGDDPESPEYRFRREVDFGSAACMVVRRDVFADARGFDPLYRLAYFEDADLCFRLRERGLRLTYEPTSRIRHVRSVSAPESELREVFAANHQTFIRRWRDTIVRRPSLQELQRDPAARLAARDLHASERLLVLEDASGRDHEAAEGLRAPWRVARGLALERPTARVTLLAKSIDTGTAEDLLAAGVEVARDVDEERWLVARRGHYSAVIGRRDLPEPLRGWLEATQTQASFWPLDRFMGHESPSSPRS